MKAGHLPSAGDLTRLLVCLADLCGGHYDQSVPLSPSLSLSQVSIMVAARFLLSLYFIVMSVSPIKRFPF